MLVIVMNKTECTIKQLFFMNYSNHSDKSISVYDFLKVYLQKYNGERSLFQIDFINMSGLLVIDSNRITIYCPVNDYLLDSISIYLDDKQNITYTYNGYDLFLSRAINSSESNLLKKIFIGIGNCPSDIQGDLLKARQEDLEMRAARKRALKHHNRYKLYNKRKLERRKLI